LAPENPIFPELGEALQSTRTQSPEPPPTIDEVKDYWNRRPCNVRHSDLEVGTQEYFDAVEARKYFVEPHIPGFADFARWNGKRVLEIGCGIGTDAINFARHGAEYVAVELSEASLDLARKRFELYGLAGELYVADVEDLVSSGVPPGPYDLIYSFGVLHHTVNPSKALSELNEFAGPETELRIMLYAQNSWKAMLIEQSLDQPEAQDECPIALTFTDNDAEQLLLSAGFSVTSIRQDHIFPYQVDKYIRYEYELEPWFREMPIEMRKAMDRHLGWHLLISARKNRKQVVF